VRGIGMAEVAAALLACRRLWGNNTCRTAFR
jgi:hypothetical protein